MRIEKPSVNNFAHIYNRGVKKTTLFKDDRDYWRFLHLLRYFNNEKTPIKALQEISHLRKNNTCAPFEWPAKWQPQKSLTEIIAYCLMPNHFHLLLREIKPNGIATFMQKIGTGYTNYFNKKYEESGRIFQGPYKIKIIYSEEYLQYTDAYIQIINPFELFDGGIENAKQNFDKAFQFVIESPFNSLGESFGKRNLSIINREIFSKKFPSLENYKEFSKDILFSKNVKESYPEFFSNF